MLNVRQLEHHILKVKQNSSGYYNKFSILKFSPKVLTHEAEYFNTRFCPPLF